MLSEIRPCIVGGNKALFHGFVSIERPVEPDWKGAPAGILKIPAAIVETIDGQVELAHPTAIRFTDSEEMFARYRKDVHNDV